MIKKKYLKFQQDESWRDDLRKSMKNQDRIRIPRVKMKELDPNYRVHNHSEVNLGLTLEQALLESKRCLDCNNPQCITGCPIKINIPKFIKNIERNNILEAAKILKQTSALPAVCGRVCPQEKQCESKCIHLKIKNDPVAIGYLERFAADFERENNSISIPKINKNKKIKIAVIGSGPAGLSFAGNMAKLGYKITVFEALHEIGGVLKYGIPEFRLPNYVIDAEIDVLKKNGIQFIKNIIIGKTVSYQDLHNEGYKGIFVAVGAGAPNFMNIPGENLAGILSSNEYLTRVNLMGASKKRSDTPVFLVKKVAVIGGGNTAIDSVRTARRLGAEKAMIIYRRSKEEMPARTEEIRHAEAEKIIFMNLYTPIKYIGDEKGQVKQVCLQKMKLGDLDSSGRRRAIPVPNLTKILDVDMIIVAVGVSPNPMIINSFKGLDISKSGTILVNQNTLQTNLLNIYAGGDIIRGGSTVILAMGDGFKAADSMHKILNQN
ncbi:MAG: NADPH-dependent glutamate synthase [Bacteroidales bacterium OttesenSCG-928-I14]|jgi:glutamate synthase (NADPH/NADH) small chain|nr:NADPH-dependent glutamate synthase [Bacteroidales bacterium OttesenSCG-928-I14]